MFSKSLVAFQISLQCSFIFLTGICHGTQLTNPSHESQLSRASNQQLPVQMIFVSLYHWLSLLIIQSRHHSILTFACTIAASFLSSCGFWQSLFAKMFTLILTINYSFKSQDHAKHLGSRYHFSSHDSKPLSSPSFSVLLQYFFCTHRPGRQKYTEMTGLDLVNYETERKLK